MKEKKKKKQWNDGIKNKTANYFVFGKNFTFLFADSDQTDKSAG